VGHPRSDSVGLLVLDGMLCNIRGTGIVPDVLTRTRKPERGGVRARIDHMELSYDEMFKLFMYIICSNALHIFKCHNCITR
jgi:hypothetical protein